MGPAPQMRIERCKHDQRDKARSEALCKECKAASIKVRGYRGGSALGVATLTRCVLCGVWTAVPEQAEGPLRVRHEP